jgi:cytochrome c-type biogenesis protein CcsB
MKFLRLFVSTRVTLVLLLLFAVSMAVATFIENDHGTAVAVARVYEAWWFELIMAWLAVNFLMHIRQYRLFAPNRWPVGLFHVAFVIIVIGAGVTRYFSRSGVIHIREGHTSGVFFTSESYVQMQAHTAAGQAVVSKPAQVVAKYFEPQSVGLHVGERRFYIKIDSAIAAAKEKFVAGSETFIEVAATVGSGREDYILQPGRWVQLGSVGLDTRAESPHPLRIFKQDGQWFIHSDMPLQLMSMLTQEMGRQEAQQKAPLRQMTLYQWDGGAFMVKAIHEQARLTYEAETDEQAARNLLDVVHLTVKDENNSPVHRAWVKLVSFQPAWSTFALEGKQYAVTFGPKAVHLPFSLHLSEFQLERYPGSQSPSSYASEVMVMDGKTEFPFRIYMNNVLDYKGYRFYQSSYDTDEQGTVLSINQDRPGTYITYVGYALLAVGMFLTLFSKGSRFSFLNSQLKKVSAAGGPAPAGQTLPGKLAYVPGAAVLALICWALITGMMTKETDEPAPPGVVPPDHAAAYGRLIVQDLDGRMKPLNTLANEMVRKLTGKSYVVLPAHGSYRLTPEQFLLAVQLDPVGMSKTPLLKADEKKSHALFEKLGMAPRPALSFSDFLDEKGNYKIQPLVEEANQLKPAARNEGHKELLKTDERFNIFYGLLTGDFLRLFPNRHDANNTWYTGAQYALGFDEEDAVFVKNITPMYIEALNKGFSTGDWSEAEEVLSYISLYQQKAGARVYPEARTVQAELLHNKLNLGAGLFGPFWLLGFVMLALALAALFVQRRWLQVSWTAGQVLAWIGFLTFTFHLALRWYIAKHPPWSDGFEMLVFVAWGVLLFGLLFSVKSRFTLPLGLLFSGTLLFVAFLDWLNPEITNLVPVLHSYWLKIHVSVIVSGYAPLALAAVVGLLSLLLLVFKPRQRSAAWQNSMKELRMVNEMSVTIGLFLLAVGTFLGGVWANESWGRYWAWDPKETWALISVIVYAMVLHLRLVPDLRSSLYYNLASLWAFSAIIMTSFGVNYYLSGLHSYAKGDPVPVPLWVYWVVIILALVSLLAIRAFQKLTPQERESLRG